MVVEAELTDFKKKWPSGIDSTKPCPKLLRIDEKFFCQRTFLWVDDYRREVCYNCFEYDYCLTGIDYLQQLIQFGVRSLEDIISLNQTKFCKPRSIDESLVTKWKHILSQITSYERKFLKKLLDKMVETFI